MENFPIMTDRHAQILKKAVVSRAKIYVHLIANPDNILIQVIGKTMLCCFNWGIERYVRKNSL